MAGPRPTPPAAALQLNFSEAADVVDRPLPGPTGSRRLTFRPPPWDN